MDRAHSLSSPIIIRSLDLKNDTFRPCENGEELLDLEVPYLSVIGALMCLANCTHLYIVFFYQFISQIQLCSNPKTLELYQTYFVLPQRNN